MSMGSFRHTNRKRDIIEMKNKLRERDPLRRTIGIKSLDIGFGFAFRHVHSPRPPGGGTPPTSPGNGKGD